MITAVAAKHRDGDVFHMEITDSGETEIRILVTDGDIGNIGVVFDMEPVWTSTGMLISGFVFLSLYRNLILQFRRQRGFAKFDLEPQKERTF